VPTDLPPRRHPSPGHPPTPGWFERVVTAVLVVAVFGLFAAAPLEHWTPAKWSVPFFLAAWLPLIALHEAGHAITAHLLGWRVHRVVVGGGLRIASGRVGGVPCELHALPLFGFVTTTPRDLAGVRWKRALIYFMGPGVELALVGVVLLILGPARLLDHDHAIAHIAVQAVTAAAFVGACFNLVPFPGGALESLGAPSGPSDGLGIIHSFTRPVEDFRGEDAD
jgi:hypothetical protein